MRRIQIIFQRLVDRLTVTGFLGATYVYASFVFGSILLAVAILGAYAFIYPADGVRRNDVPVGDRPAPPVRTQPVEQPSEQKNAPHSKVEANMSERERPQATDQKNPSTAESLGTSRTTRHLWWELIAVAICGALGGFVNVFIGDSGLHLPTIDQGVFRPGYIGVVFVGSMAAVVAWLATQTSVLVGELALSPKASLRLSELSTAIIVGFGGARWFKSETETTIFRKIAVVAASKEANTEAAAAIASGTPLEALTAANRMH
ncbi:hypothetical protein [Tunturiibacter gelidoferens]|uniref:Uncharacterized protein n=1 Tax=Tunturiibacter lichenicola TaxID=2051959 RepID=A0A7Y9NL22_9BACT|nr:hypothetical protein [Edaphobacter lichenicola]NYF51202.1 hypothetical protein [Edaphobacter lichenicola]